ncbi:MAG TPA: lytic transglycosylase domain-containing protein [Candidatus Binataceae bacterium]|nr:lytic transglycosylase domain-containing protein [Candidatus Binataceae bacterium]
MKVRAAAALLAAACLALGSAAPALAQQAGAPGREHVDTTRLFRAAARLYGLDPDLLAAIAAVESGASYDALSRAGAQGLMQLMPSTSMRFGVIDPFDPVSNTLGAARLLNYLHRAGTAALTLPEILAAYNAGEGAVEKYGGIPPYPETRQYVKKVLIAYLLGTESDSLAAKIHGAAPPSEPVLIRDRSPLDQLAEIRRLRALALERARPGGWEQGAR